MANLKKILYPILILSCFNSTNVKAELTGNMEAQYRYFTNNSQLNGQENSDIPSFKLEPEYYHLSEDEKDIITFRPFLRIDDNDSNRSHFDIRQLDYLHIGEDWEFRAGISKVFWGVTESRHLVDIINQTDIIEDVDGEDKFGQPMLNYSIFRDWGNLRFYYLPYFREQIFPGEEGRLRSPILIDNDNAIYTSSAKQWHPDFAIRYYNNIGYWDLGLGHFHGTSREPNFEYNIDKNILTPKYEIIDQTSLDLQYTYDAWLLKLEAIGRAGHGDYFFASTFGFEYTFFNILDGSSDLGFLMEYNIDQRDENAPTTIFDDDIFIGTRLTLNDIDDKSLLAGLMTDVNNSSKSAVAEYSQRLNDNFKLEIDARFWFENDEYDPTAYFNKEDHIQVNLLYYF